MNRTTVNVLLAVALVSPVALFFLLFSRLHVDALISAAVAVAAGWALNVVWAASARRQDPSAATSDFGTVARRYGWACPAVLVAITWAVLR